MRQSPHIERARKLLSGLAQEHKALFTLRDAHRIINRNTDAESIRPVLELLAAHNYIARTEGRRRDSERWQVNPRAVRSWPSPQTKRTGKPGQ